MKKILVVNSSPKGRASGTLKITNAFLEGFKLIEDDVQVDYAHLAEYEFNYCLGCGTCHHTTPGICHFADDMSKILPKYSKADIIIVNFPLHTYGMSSLLEKFIERLQPLLSYVKRVEQDNYISLDREYNRTTNNNFIMVSTCGSTNIKEVYQAVDRRIDLSFKGHATKLFFPTTLYPYVDEPLNGINFYKAIQWAGQDFARYGHITPEICKVLDNFRGHTEEIILVSTEIAERYYQINDIKPRLKLVAFGKVNQMLKSYNASLLKTENQILQLKFTDLHEMYQLVFEKESFSVIPKGKEVANCSIVTTYQTWCNLIAGKTDLLKTAVDQTLTFTGDEKMMVALDNGLLFTPNKKNEDMSLFLSSGRSKTWVNEPLNHTYLQLIPWIICYTTISLAPIASLIVSLTISVIILMNKKATDVTYFDKGNMLIFLSILLTNMLLYNYHLVEITYLYMVISFTLSLFFGLSLFFKIPLSCYIGYHDYFKSICNINYFIKKHRLITFLWTTFFMVVPFIAIMSRLLNIQNAYIHIFILALLMVTSMKWLSLNYGKYLFHRSESQKTSSKSESTEKGV